MDVDNNLSNHLETDDHHQVADITIKEQFQSVPTQHTSSIPHNQSIKCEHCEATESPVWRSGPSGPSTLCNTCGYLWTRQNYNFSISSLPLQDNSSDDTALSEFHQFYCKFCNLTWPLGYFKSKNDIESHIQLCSQKSKHTGTVRSSFFYLKNYLTYSSNEISLFIVLLLNLIY